MNQNTNFTSNSKASNMIYPIKYISKYFLKHLNKSNVLFEQNLYNIYYTELTKISILKLFELYEK